MELVGGHSFVNAGLNTFPFSPGSSGCCGDGPYLKEQEFFSISNSAEGGCGRQPAGSARVLFVFGRSFEIPQGNYTGPFPLFVPQGLLVLAQLKEKWCHYYWRTFTEILKLLSFTQEDLFGPQEIFWNSLYFPWFSSSVIAHSSCCIYFVVGFNVSVSFSMFPWCTCVISIITLKKKDCTLSEYL